MVALELPGQRAVVSDADAGIRSYAVDEVEVLCCCAERSRFRSGAPALVTQPPRDAGPDPIDVAASWTCVDSAGNRVDLETRPQGTTLVHHISYRLEPGGLVATSSVTNDGPEPLVYAPEIRAKLTVGGSIEDAFLHVPARMYARPGELDDGWRPIGQAPLNPRVADRIGSSRLDLVFSAIERDHAERAGITLFRPGARHVTLWFGRTYGHIGVSTPPRPAETGWAHLGVRVMTAAAYEDVALGITLAPGASYHAQWGVRVYRP